jgi:quercetin dioxygenase-like cupin family protein
MKEPRMSPSATPAPIVRAKEDGERRAFLGGGLHIWKAKAEETGGAFLLFEDRLDHGKVTPLHTHPDSDETMIVLEGEILMHLAGAEHRVAAGGLAFAPRGMPHAFLVLSATARLLCLHTPGNCEAFYRGASEPLEGPDDSGPVDFGRVRASGQEHGGIEILGPPPFGPSAAPSAPE